jgi:hypothetical protein
MWDFHFQRRVGLAPWTAVPPQPGRAWPWPLRLGAALGTLPILIAVAAALLVGLFVMMTLGVVRTVLSLPLRLLSLALTRRDGGGGRRNVRVIVPDRRDDEI